MSASVSVGTRCLASQCDSLCLNDNLRYRLPQGTPNPDLYYIKHRFAHALEMYCRNHICLPCTSGHNHHPLQNKQEKMASSMDKTDTCIKLRNFKHCFIDIKMMKVLIKTQIWPSNWFQNLFRRKYVVNRVVCVSLLFQTVLVLHLSI